MWFIILGIVIGFLLGVFFMGVGVLLSMKGDVHIVNVPGGGQSYFLELNFPIPKESKYLFLKIKRGW